MTKVIKNIHQSLFLGTALLFTQVSCFTDKLEPSPQTFFSDLVVFDTPERVQQQVNSLYSSSSI
jgi:hypothetical protein